MSASPAGASSATPNGGPPNVPRRRPKTNPLVAPKKPVRRPPQAGVAPPAGALPPRVNGATHSPRPNVNVARPTPPPATAPINGRPEAPPQDDKYTDFPLITTKRSLLQGLRHHVMRLAASKPVDFTNEEAWTRPVRLHRRDPGVPPEARRDGEDSKEDLVDDKEREKQEALKAERKRIREENLAQIAPSNKKAKHSSFHKKAEQVFVADDSPEAQKRSQLRYEEAMPWHLEDDDNKNSWVGTYEAPMSERHIMLMPEEREHQKMNADGQIEAYSQGVFRLVPLEKWYKFTQTNKFRALTIDEAEAWMKKRAKDPRFLTDAQKALEQKRQEEMVRSRTNKLFMRAAGRGDEDKVRIKRDPDALVEGQGDAADADDIDFAHEELFQDDEEGPMFEGIEPETAKEAEDRIKKEQRGANIFGLNDEKKVDEEAEREKKIKELQKSLEKGTRKALVKRERNYEYETDSESNPYSTSSESDTSDSEAEEKEKDEEGKETEENKAGKEKAKDGDRPSGTSSKGTNTPLGRPKTSDTIKKSSSLLSLKRPGSPDLSEASGNESSRKKHKSKHHTSAQSPDATSSRPMSPAPDSARSPTATTGQQPSQIRKSLKHGAGSGSDSEATDSGRHKRQKLVLKTSPDGTPRGSPGASRAGSPVAGQPPRKPSTLLFPTADEVIEKVPPEGIAMMNLIAAFRGRVSGENKHAFVDLVKRTLKFEKETKMLHRRPAGGAAAADGGSGAGAA